MTDAYASLSELVLTFLQEQESGCIIGDIVGNMLIYIKYNRYIHLRLTLYRDSDSGSSEYDFVNTRI